jgi:hypothetical protein
MAELEVRTESGIFSLLDLKSEISDLRFPIPANDWQRSTMADSRKTGE